jgi:hypothetical protein
MSTRESHPAEMHRTVLDCAGPGQRVDKKGGKAAATVLNAPECGGARRQFRPWHYAHEPQPELQDRTERDPNVDANTSPLDDCTSAVIADAPGATMRGGEFRVVIRANM